MLGQPIQQLDIIFAMGVEYSFLKNNLGLATSNGKLVGEAHKAKYWGGLIKVYL